MSEEKTNNETSTDTINSIAKWMKVMAVGFVLAWIAAFVIGYVQRQYDNEQDTRQLNARIVESCHNFNRNQTLNRVAAHKKLLALAELAGKPIDEPNLTPEATAKIATYDAEMADIYQYHKCDLQCAIASTNKDIQDCPPSDNEEGI